MAVSIVIPAYNEELYISNTLNVLIASLNGFVEFEIILVNNFSNDKTSELIRDFDLVKVINLHEKVTVSKARNIGWRASKYEVVAFIDADIIVTRQWVERLILFECEQSNCVSGSRVGLSRLPSSMERHWFGLMRKNESQVYINSGNLITTKVVLEAISGFDEGLISGEDVDFSVRAREKEFLVVDDPMFVVHHEGYPKTIKQFYLREVWHGQGDFRSVKTFLDSKVAVCSVLVVALILLSLSSLALGFFTASLFFFFCLFSFMVLFAVKKFRINSAVSLGYIFVLSLVYFIGRFFSFFRRAKL